MLHARVHAGRQEERLPQSPKMQADLAVIDDVVRCAVVVGCVVWDFGCEAAVTRRRA